MVTKIVDKLFIYVDYTTYRVAGKVSGDKWLVVDHYGRSQNNDHAFTEEELLDYINRNNYSYSLDTK